MNPTVRLGLAIALTALAATAPALPVLARGKPPVVVQAPPPPPPPPVQGPVGLPDQMVAEAAAYEAYMTRTNATSAAWADGAQVAATLRATASYDPQSLMRGAIAYAAIAALQDPMFVAAARAAGATAESRRLAVNALIADPAYVIGYAGSAQAAGYAKQALGDHALRLYAVGKAVKQSAYDMQHQPWSAGPVADRDGRLGAIRSAANSPLVAPADRLTAMRSAISTPGALGLAAPSARPPYTPLIAHALSLAAIAAMGEANNASYQRMSYLVADVNGAFCLNMARLNLMQCLAVAKPHYEDVFCMGQHVMMEPARCLARYSGVGVPLEVNVKPLKVPAPKPYRPPPPKRRKH